MAKIGTFFSAESWAWTWMFLRSMARAYPLECSLGSMELLFESRQDIEVLVRTLAEEISEAHRCT